MPDSLKSAELCRYHYDPLDRQCGCTVVQQPALQRFLCKNRLATETQGAARWSIFQHDDQLLAQQHCLGTDATTTLLATNQPRSVLNALEGNRLNPIAYSAYGHRPALSGLLSLLGFNGEKPDPVTGHYHLGNGFRQFNPALMRFNSPDGLSPFREGGINAYGYCGGDPVNATDPSGHVRVFGPIPVYNRPSPPPNLPIPTLIPRVPPRPRAAPNLYTPSPTLTPSAPPLADFPSAPRLSVISGGSYVSLDRITPQPKRPPQWKRDGFASKEAFEAYWADKPKMNSKGAIIEPIKTKPAAPAKKPLTEEARKRYGNYETAMRYARHSHDDSKAVRIRDGLAADGYGYLFSRVE